MVHILKITRMGTSLHICMKKEICKKLGLKHGDTMLLEEVEIESNVLGNSLTARFGDDVNVNALMMRKNNVRFI